ncbi:MAG: transposase [Bacteroidota bacterium]
MSIKKILTTIIARISVQHKWQADFLYEIFALVFSIQGRLTFENLSRYSHMSERTFRRNYKKFFDWLDFNWQLILLYAQIDQGVVIAAIDCSYIPKAGKATYGLDKFFSSIAGRAKKGLEISLLCLINTQNEKAWSLDVSQTPAGLSTKQDDPDVLTRVDHYMDQLKKAQTPLSGVQYIVADGFYAKNKVFKTMNQIGKSLITKLRPDANLRYLYQGESTGKPGRPTQYDGKVDWKNLDLSKWEYIGTDDKYDYLEIYTQVLNSPRFKLNLCVVMVVNTKTNKYILLACTDINLGARTILKYYQLRFKIEFLFRDAKQFCGLTHCQARSKEALHFHFNLSLAAVNVAQVNLNFDPAIKSMNVLVRKAYNRRLVEWLFSQLSSKAEFDLNQPEVQKAIAFGASNYS